MMRGCGSFFLWRFGRSFPSLSTASALSSGQAHDGKRLTAGLRGQRPKKGERAVAAAAEQRAAHHAKGGARLSWGDHTSKTSLDRSLFDKHPDDNAFPAADIGQSQHSAADSVMWNSLHEDVMFKGICGDVDRGGGPSREQRAA
mmetsp:Transcript_33454/g.71314  ORF Transcript_33454/g.71314 Transcript_33454/m.71314 type:complete len:144 (+) Transcript_33454:226-657(+)